MKFASPEFLYALIAIAIPIVIHFFNFRKFKKVYFSNLSFLKEVTQETQSKSKLKHLLILASRILAITFLVFAFAQPFKPINLSDTTNNNTVGIYIDNSFSMESTSENGTLLNEAKLKAIEIVNSYKKSDHFIICDNSFSAGSQRHLNSEDAIEKIEEIQISPETKMLSESISRVLSSFNNETENKKTIYAISDFQKTSADLSQLLNNSSVNTVLIPIKSSQINNLFIDSCWFDSPFHALNQQEKLTISIKNISSYDVENIPLKLFINDQLIAPASLSVKANDKTTVELTYLNKASGIQKCKIEIRDNPVTMDDSFFFSYSISNEIKILEITDNEVSNYINSVFNTDSIFNFSSYSSSQLDYSKIKTSDLVILSHVNTVTSGLASSIQKYISGGGQLIVFPPNNLNFENYKEFLSLLGINYYTEIDTSSSKIRDIAYLNKIYKNVFEGKPESNINLPNVLKHYQLSKNNTSYKNSLLKLKNGDDFLTEFIINKGKVYLFTAGLSSDYSNFTNHALFVPTLYNIGLFSQPQFPIFHTIGENSVLELNKNDNESVYHILKEDFDIIPKTNSNNQQTSVFVGQNIIKSGNYLLSNQKQEIGLSFNYDRAESDLSCLVEEEIGEQITKFSLSAELLTADITNLSSAIIEFNSGKKYWKLCIILALLFLGAEILLIKLFK